MAVQVFVVKQSLWVNQLVPLREVKLFVTEAALNCAFLRVLQVICGVRVQPPIALQSLRQAIIASRLPMQMAVRVCVAKQLHS